MASFPSVSNHLKAFGAGLVLAVLGLGLYLQFGTGASYPAVTVYKSPTCNCCSDWVTHLKDNGFEVNVKSRLRVGPVKQQLGVPKALASCHTATVGGYVVEGHVPATDMKRLLQEKPEVRGVSVPGMPVGSPGMERGNRVEPYDVVTFTAAGDTSVFAQYGQ